jgi:tetratricopeptide (TPR) repeat protein
LSIAAEIAEFDHAHQDFASALPLWQRLADAGRSGLGIGAHDRPLVLERLAEAQQGLQRNDEAATTWLQLARLVMLQENLEGAEEFAKRARQIAPAGNPAVATAFELLANIRLQRSDGRQADGEEAEAYLREALELAGSDSGARALILSGLARASIKKDLEEASSRCAQAEAVARGLRSPVIEATLLATRAFILQQQGKQMEAEAKYASFLMAERAMDYERDFPLLQMLAEASEFYSPLGNLDVVESIGRRRLSATRYAFGDRSPETARALESLANTLSHVKKFAEARDLYREGLAIFESSADGKAGAAVVLTSLGDLALDEGKATEAIDSYTKASAADPNQERDFLKRIAELQLRTANFNAAAAAYSRLAQLWDDGKVSEQWVQASLGKCVSLIRANRHDDAPKAYEALLRTVHRTQGNKNSLEELSIVRALAEAADAMKWKEARALKSQATNMATSLHVEH